MEACSHKPQHFFTWFAYNCITGKNDWLVIGCTQCHTIIKGDDDEFQAYLTQHNT